MTKRKKNEKRKRRKIKKRRRRGKRERRKKHDEKNVWKKVKYKKNFVGNGGRASGRGRRRGIEGKKKKKKEEATGFRVLLQKIPFMLAHTL